MIHNGNPPASAVRSSRVRLAAQFKRITGCLLLILLGTVAQAAGPEETYLKIFGVMDQADLLNDRGQTDAALAKYREAQTALLNLKKENPSWNAKVVTFRLNYLAGKISALAAAPAPEVTPVSEETTTSGKPPAQLPAGMSVRLLAAGAAPREVLRMRVTPGAKETGVIVVKSSMGMGATGMPIELMKLPAMKLTVGVLPKNVGDDGDINYEVVVEDADVETEADTAPGVAEAMKASLTGIKGLVIACTISDRGISKSAEARIPPGADAEARTGIETMKDAFSKSDFVLPHEAIGAGARWEVRQKVKSGGMTIDQTTVHQLVSIQDEVLTTKGSAVQQAANQKISNPMLPQAMADVIKMTGSLTNTATIRLTKLLPPQESREEHTETILAATTDGQRQTLTIKSVTSSSVESK